MITVLEMLTKQNVREFLPGQLSQLRLNADRNLSQITAHYRKSVYVTPSDHILVQILQHLQTKFELNDSRYYYYCHGQSKMTHTALGLNTETTVNGPTQKSHFYGKGINEFLIVESIDLPINFDAKSYWQSLQPVKAISHPFTDLSFNAPDGENPSNAHGSAFLSIDIGLLAVQYRHWLKAVEGYIAKPSVTQFVFQYPLVNLIASSTDVAFYNRLRMQVEGKFGSVVRPRHGLAILDLIPLTDKIWTEWLTRALTQSRRWIDIPEQTPLLYQETLADFLALPDIYFNRQNMGIYTLAYYPYLKTITKISIESGSVDNHGVYTFLERWYRRFVIGNYFAAIPKINPQYTQQAFQDEVLTPLGQSLKKHPHD